MRKLAGPMMLFLLLACPACGGQSETDERQQMEKTVEAPSRDLHSAVVVDDLDAIRLHIEAGSDLNVLEPSRASTPLITACALGKTEAAVLLMEAGADLDYQNNDGSTAVHTAAFFCNEDILKALLQRGADRYLRNKAGITAYEMSVLPFAVVRPAYESMAQALRPAGLVLDMAGIEEARPRVAEILMTESPGEAGE